MKFIQILILICATVSYIRADKAAMEKFHEIAEECKTETNASDDDVAHIFKLQSSQNDSEKCLRACVLMKIGFLDENAKIDKEKSMEIIKKVSHGNAAKENIGESILEACGDINTPEDHCEAADVYNECMLKVVAGKDAATLDD